MELSKILQKKVICTQGINSLKSHVELYFEKVIFDRILIFICPLTLWRITIIFIFHQGYCLGTFDFKKFRYLYSHKKKNIILWSIFCMYSVFFSWMCKDVEILSCCKLDICYCCEKTSSLLFSKFILKTMPTLLWIFSSFSVYLDAVVLYKAYFKKFCYILYRLCILPYKAQVVYSADLRGRVICVATLLSFSILLLIFQVELAFLYECSYEFPISCMIWSTMLQNVMLQVKYGLKVQDGSLVWFLWMYSQITEGMDLQVVFKLIVTSKVLTDLVI